MPHLLTPSQLAFTHAALLKGNEQIPWLNYRFDFSGKIDIPRLQNSFKDILTIHPILTCEFSANYKELVEAPYQDDFADFITIVNSEDEIPDLPSNKKLTQLYFLLRADSTYSVYLKVHHAIFDDYSVDVLLRHLKFCYAEQSDAISIKHNYFDFMAEMYNNKQPSISVNEPKNLQNILPFKANSQEKKVLHRKFIYESEQIRALKNKTNNEKEPIIFLTFFVWLLQYYGLEEFYLSVPFSLRKSEVDRENIGYYANLKILHFNPLYKIDNFAELLVLVREKWQEASVHKDDLFENTHTESKLPNIVFCWQYSRQPCIQFNDEVEVVVEYLANKYPRFDIGLDLRQEKKGSDAVYGFWEFNTKVVPEYLAVNIPRHFTNLLNGVIRHGVLINLSTYTPLTPSEIALLDHWNDTENIFPELKQTPYQIIYQQLNTHPNKMVIYDDNDAYTAQNLLDRADKVAAFLLSKNINKAEVCAINLKPCFELAAILLGIWKIGAVSFILDTRLSDEQIAERIRIAEAKICFDEDTLQDILSQEIIVSAPAPYEERMPCYIATSSGTTGKPKVMLLPVEALTKWLVLKTELPEFHQTDQQENLLLMTALGFDAALWDIFRALSFGAVLYLLDREKLESNDLCAYIQVYNINHMTMIPRQLQQLHDYINKSSAKIENLKIVSTGDSLPVKLAEACSEKGIQIYNGYGETEAGIGEILAPFKTGKAYFPKPLPNMQLVICNSQGQLLPPGSIGELYVEGKGIMLKKLDEDLPVSRCFNTGMQAYFDEANAFQPIGRQDRVIKYYGQSINLEELEHILMQQPYVIDAIVVFNQTQHETEAFLLLERGQTLDLQRLYQALKKALPSFAIPHRYWQIAELPLTSRGKVDYNALKNNARCLLFQRRFNIAPDLQKIAEDKLKELVGIEKLPEDWLEQPHEFLGLGSFRWSRFVCAVLDEVKIPAQSLSKVRVIPMGDENIGGLLKIIATIKSPKSPRNQQSKLRNISTKEQSRRYW